METALEKILIRRHKAEMTSFINSHPESFEELIYLSKADKQPYSWRAAWLLWSSMTKNDKRIRKHLKEMIFVLPDRKDNQNRELFKVLEQMEISEDLEGQLFNHCMSVWEKTEKQPSVRINAFKVLYKIAQKHPELATELNFVTLEHYTESLSPGVKHSLNKMIRNKS